MSWIDDMNKKLQKQREDFKESKENGKTLSRVRSYSRSFSKPRPKEHFQKMSKKGIDSQKKSGKLKVFQTKGTKAATKAQDLKMKKNWTMFLEMLPNNGITYEMAQDACESLGLRRIQASRYLMSNCEFEFHSKTKGGKTQWTKSIFKKR